MWTVRQPHQHWKKNHQTCQETCKIHPQTSIVETQHLLSCSLMGFEFWPKTPNLCMELCLQTIHTCKLGFHSSQVKSHCWWLSKIVFWSSLLRERHPFWCGLGPRITHQWSIHPEVCIASASPWVAVTWGPRQMNTGLIWGRVTHRTIFVVLKKAHTILSFLSRVLPGKKKWHITYHVPSGTWHRSRFVRRWNGPRRAFSSSPRMGTGGILELELE